MVKVIWKKNYYFEIMIQTNRKCDLFFTLLWRVLKIEILNRSDWADVCSTVCCSNPVKKQRNGFYLKKNRTNSKKKLRFETYVVETEYGRPCFEETVCCEDFRLYNNVFTFPFYFRFFPVVISPMVAPMISTTNTRNASCSFPEIRRIFRVGISDASNGRVGRWKSRLGDVVVVRLL